MNYRDAQDLAIEFGAKRFKGDHLAPAFPCWADRIAYIPIAAERGTKRLAGAIAEANRYA